MSAADFGEASFEEFVKAYPALLLSGEVPVYTEEELEARWQKVLDLVKGES